MSNETFLPLVCFVGFRNVLRIGRAIGHLTGQRRERECFPTILDETRTLNILYSTGTRRPRPAALVCSGIAYSERRVNVFPTITASIFYVIENTKKNAENSAGPKKK